MDHPTSLPAALPLVRDAGFSMGGVDPRWLALLGLILCIAFVVAARLRKGRASVPERSTWRALTSRLGMTAVEEPLRVVQSARLSARASVHVLRWGEREWLIGCTDQQLTVLADPSKNRQQADRAVSESSLPVGDV